MTRILTTLTEILEPTPPDTLACFSLKDDQQQLQKPASLMARAVLRKMLSAETSTEPELWRFQRGENGKPEALFDGAPSSFAVSISHSGPYLACAIAEAEALGIDIEQHKDWRDLKNIADLAFGSEERRLVAAEGADAFYRIWTLREAHAKATGLGLAQAADGKDRFAGVLRKEEEAAKATWPDAAGTWHFHYERPMPNLSYAIAVRCPTEPVWSRLSLS